MSQPQPLNTLLDTLLSDAALGQDLSQEEQAAVRTFVGELMEGISQVTQTSSEPTLSLLNLTEPDPADTNDIDTLLSELGLESEEDESTDKLIRNLLTEQPDSTLLAVLGEHVDSASEIVELLERRPIGKQELDTVRQVELQLVAVSLYISDLRQPLERQVEDKPKAAPRPRWLKSLKSTLLHEFHFINDLLR